MTFISFKEDYVAWFSFRKMHSNKMNPYTVVLSDEHTLYIYFIYIYFCINCLVFACDKNSDVIVL